MEDYSLENKRDEFVSLLAKRIDFYRNRIRKADNSNILELGMRIGQLEIAISIIEKEDKWTEEDWLNHE